MTASMNPPSSILERSANGASCHGYDVSAGFYDEMAAPGGGLRPHWQPFLGALDALGLDELTRRWEEAKHLLRENGVTGNAYGDPRGMDRPWEWEPIARLVA